MRGSNLKILYGLDTPNLIKNKADTIQQYHPMDPFVIFYMGLLLASPFIAYLIRIFLNIGPYYALGLGAIFIFIMIGFSTKMRIPYYTFPLFILFLYYFIWDFYNGRFAQNGMIDILAKNYTLHTIAILLIIENTKFNDKFIKYCLEIFKILAVITVIVSFIQFAIDSSFFEPATMMEAEKNWDYLRNNSVWGYLSPLDIGLSFLPLIALLINANYQKQKYVQSIAWLLCAGLVAFMNNSRWVLLNFMLLLLLPFFIVKDSKVKKLTLTLSGALIVGLLLIGTMDFMKTDTQQYIADRMLSKTADSRLLALDLFSKFFPHNPVFGTGVRFNPDLKIALAERSSQLHVGYLSHLYEYGIVGSLLLFSFWIIVAKKFFRTAKLSGQYGVFVGFLCLIIGNFTLVEYSMFHTGLIFLFVFNKYYTDKIKWENQWT